MPSSASSHCTSLSFPTRRSSDLFLRELHAGTLSMNRFIYFILQDYVYLLDFAQVLCQAGAKSPDLETLELFCRHAVGAVEVERSLDRKSTRLNSSHLGISYAVFCFLPLHLSLFPYTTLFRSVPARAARRDLVHESIHLFHPARLRVPARLRSGPLSGRRQIA